MGDMFSDFEDEFSGDGTGNVKGEKPPIELAGALVLNRDKSILWSDGEQDVWIPKSQITSQNLSADGSGTIFVKEWFLKKEGLI